MYHRQQYIMTLNEEVCIKMMKQTFRSPEMLAPARIPVAEGKKMENMPKKLPSGPRQLGTKLAAKIFAVEGKKFSLPERQFKVQLKFDQN